MRRIADWAVVDGALHRRMALVLDEQGVVRDVERAAPHEQPSKSLRGAVVVPGGTDACALGGLVACGAGPSTEAGDAGPATLDALAQLVATVPAEVLRQRALVWLGAAVRAGITTVALPHLAPQPGPADAAPAIPVSPGLTGPDTTLADPYPVATAFADAAAEVGVRLTLLDAVVLRGPALAAAARASSAAARAAAEAWVRCSHPSLEAAVQHLDGLVRHLLVRRTSSLSWGLLLPRPALVGADATVALRLRLGHLPTVFVDAGERFAENGRQARVPGIRGATLAAQATGSGALDACCAWLVTATTPANLADVEALERWGVPVLRDPKSTQSGALRFGSASGTQTRPYAPSTWLSTVLRPKADAVDPEPLPPARVAANALGLRGGTLRPDTWADYVVLRPPAGENLLNERATLTRALAGVSGTPALEVAEVYVAGQRIWGQTPLT